MKRFLAMFIILGVSILALIGCTGSVEVKFELAKGSFVGSVVDGNGAAVTLSDYTYSITVYEAASSETGYYLGTMLTDGTDYDLSVSGNQFTIANIEWGGYFIEVDLGDDYTPYTLYVYYLGLQEDWTHNIQRSFTLVEKIKGLRIIATWENAADIEGFFTFPAVDGLWDEGTVVDEWTSGYYADALTGGYMGPDVLGTDTAFATSCEYETDGTYARGVVYEGLQTYEVSEAATVDDCATKTEAVTYDDSTTGQIIIDIKATTANSADWYGGESPEASEGDIYEFGMGLLTFRHNVTTAAASELTSEDLMLTVSVYNDEGLLTSYAAPMLYQDSYAIPYRYWRVMEAYLYSQVNATEYPTAKYRYMVDMVPFGLDDVPLLRDGGVKAGAITADLGGR